MAIYLITKRPKYFSWFNLMCNSAEIQLITLHWHQQLSTHNYDHCVAIIVDSNYSANQHLIYLQHLSQIKSIPILFLNNCDNHNLIRFISIFYQKHPTFASQNTIPIAPGIFFDQISHCLIQHGDTLPLTTIEYKLLKTMCNNFDKVFTPNYLMLSGVLKMQLVSIHFMYKYIN